MSGLDDYRDRMGKHMHGVPPVGPAGNVAEYMADMDAAHARGQPTALPAGNLGWLLGLWYRGPIGRGLFLLFLLIPLIVIASVLPPVFAVIISLLMAGLAVTALGMIAYGLARRLFGKNR